MIRISPLDNRRIEISWDTGTDYQFLKYLTDLIHLRNNELEKRK